MCATDAQFRVNETRRAYRFDATTSVSPRHVCNKRTNSVLIKPAGHIGSMQLRTYIYSPRHVHNRRTHSVLIKPAGHIGSMQLRAYRHVMCATDAQFRVTETRRAYRFVATTSVSPRHVRNRRTNSVLMKPAGHIGSMQLRTRVSPRHVRNRRTNSVLLKPAGHIGSIKLRGYHHVMCATDAQIPCY